MLSSPSALGRESSFLKLPPPSALYLFLFFELLSLRLILRFVLNIRIGWAGMTDYDLLVPATLAFFVYLNFLQKDTPLPWHPSRRKTFQHFIAILVFLLVSLLFSSWSFYSNSFFKGLWFLFLGALVVSGVRIFIPLSYFFSNKKKWSFLPCLLLAFSAVIYQHSWEHLWPTFGKGTVAIVCNIFPQMFQMGRCEVTLDKTVILVTKYFRANLDPGCLGVDGQFLNVISCFLFYSFEKNSSGITPLFLRWAVGAAGLFLLNIFRILLFSWVAIATIRTNWSSYGVRFFLTSFHAHLGWVLYAIFLYWLNSFFSKKRPITPTRKSFPMATLPQQS